MSSIPKGWLTTEQTAKKITEETGQKITGQAVRLFAREDEGQGSTYIVKIGKIWYVSPEWPQLDYWRKKAEKRKFREKTAAEKADEIQKLHDKISALETQLETMQTTIDNQRKVIDNLESSRSETKKSSSTSSRIMGSGEAKTLIETVQEWQGSQRALADHLGIPESTLRSRIKKARQILA